MKFIGSRRGVASDRIREMTRYGRLNELCGQIAILVPILRAPSNGASTHAPALDREPDRGFDDNDEPILIIDKLDLLITDFR